MMKPVVTSNAGNCRLPATTAAPQAVGSLILDDVGRTAALPFAEPDRFNIADFRRLLVAATLAGASDITIQTDARPRVEVEGRLYRLGRRPWTASEISTILAEISHAPNAGAEILGRRILDFSCEIPFGPGARQRFRVNATGIHARDGFGIEITIRILPARTPDIQFARLTVQEIAAMSPPGGLVIIAGATGSGKSATMAAMTRLHLECRERPVKIVDIQAPIEYTYRDVAFGNVGLTSTIGQSEVGRHIPDFASGVWSALRRKPHIINVGEARDLPTISAALEAAMTGHLVYTTTHAGSVHDCIRRLLAVFPANERDHRASDLGVSLRFIMVQQLIQRTGENGRIPLREWLSFSGPVREALLESPPGKWPGIVHRIMTGRRQVPDGLHLSLRKAAGDLIGRGILDPGEVSRATGLSFSEGSG